MKPRLLLSCSRGRYENYKRLFENSGFSAFGGYLPEESQRGATALCRADGLVLCGGGDIDVSFLGEENCGSEEADIERDKREFELFSTYFACGKPIFGICRGMQLINIARGGTLCQHLPTASAHRSAAGEDLYHMVENVAGTTAYRLFGKETLVNSAHHQGCGKLGDGIFVMQRHADGTIEGLYGDRLLGVQWHPERLGLCSKKTLTTTRPAGQMLAREFLTFF